jgi:hypothetical protein
MLSNDRYRVHVFFLIQIRSIASCSFLQRWSAECARSGDRAGGSLIQQHQFTHPRQSQPAGVARYNAARTVKACGNSLIFGLFYLRFGTASGKVVLLAVSFF